MGTKPLPSFPPSPPLLKCVLWLGPSQTTIWSLCCKPKSLSHSWAAPLALWLPAGYTKHLSQCAVHTSAVPQCPHYPDTPVPGTEYGERFPPCKSQVTSMEKKKQEKNLCARIGLILKYAVRTQSVSWDLTPIKRRLHAKNGGLWRKCWHPQIPKASTDTPF